MPRSAPRVWWIAAPLAYIVYLFHLTATGLLGPDEPRYAFIARAIYINGIQTAFPTEAAQGDDVDGICKTMKKLAAATCQEITGVYNATGGLRTDIGECLTNIGKDSDSPAVYTLQKMMFEALTRNPPEDLTIYAHSQGGLMTQEAIADLKGRLLLRCNDEKEAMERLSHLSVKSFGTAQAGWPQGPQYEQFTNHADPVPGLIAGAQVNHPFATFLDSANVPSAQQHFFESPHFNPIHSHSMDNVYIPEMIGVKGQPKCCE